MNSAPISDFMNKLLLFLFCFTLSLGAQSQNRLYAPAMWDNWSVTLAGGVTHPAVYSLDRSLLKPTLTVGVKKQFTASFGLGIEGEVFQRNRNLNLSRFVRSQLHMLSYFNLFNLLAGYHLRPRLFDIEAKIGAGWGHAFSDIDRIPDANYLVSKVGMDFNLNLGQSRAWTLSLRPSLIYDLRSTKKQYHEAYDINRADIQVTCGITYHFGNGHGGHRPAMVAFPPMPALPSQDSLIVLRKENVELRTERDGMKDVVKHLESALQEQEQNSAECREQLSALGMERDSLLKRQLPTKIITFQKHTLESVISFEAGSTKVDASQFARIERIARYLLQHPKARMVVRGYASPDGRPSLNAQMAKQRAEIVKSLLIAQYGIRSERITAVGMGASKLFSDPEWNRVSICTIIED